jgi:GT2 family glycosyltransferase
MKTSIIIPFYGKWPLTNQRLAELHKYIPDNIEIVLVDDFSQDKDIDRCVTWWGENSRHNIIYVHNSENLGFGMSMNHGVDASTGDVVVLLSNDVQVHGNFLPMVLDKLSKEAKLLICGEMHGWDTGWNVLEINGKKRLFPYAAGWFLACKRDDWYDIGGFDPRYEKFDYEDVDLSTTAIQKGYRLTPLNIKFMLRHLSAQTVRSVYPDRERYTYKNQQRFIEKWSEILKDEEKNPYKLS